MGQVKKIGDVYYIEFYARGLLYSQLGGADLKSAEALLASVEAKIASGEVLTIVRDMNLSTFMEQYLQHVQTIYSAVSLKRFEQTTDHFLRYLKSDYPQIITLSQITPSIIESYKVYVIQAIGSKGNSQWLNLTLLLLREVLEYGITIGLIHDNPTLHVRLVKGRVKALAPTPRLNLAKDLFNKRVSLAKIYQALHLRDIAQIMYFSPIIPHSFDAMYLI